ncbi:MAG TPA: hydroxyacylglutathione hydrolase [Halothiobacillaceae bacterium]|nr:hydroxyacylglutathione hydrolase [Halothiobacillaceae bacterium]
MNQISAVHCVPVFSDNYVWIIEGENGHCAIVDLGEAEPVLAAIKTKNLKPQAVLLTHHHQDHIQGLDSFLRSHTVPVFGHADLQSQGVDHPLTENDQFSIDQIAGFSVLETPGHTQDHLCFYNDSVLFCGDTLFTLGCGRLFEGSAEQMQQSMNKLKQLPDDLTMYCGHEYTEDSLKFALHCDPENQTLIRRAKEIKQRRAQGEQTASANLGLEKLTNPFLRVGDPVIRTAIEAYVGHRIENDTEAFAQLRHWKDDFDGLKRLPD